MESDVQETMSTADWKAVKEDKEGQRLPKSTRSPSAQQWPGVFSANGSRITLGKRVNFSI